ncbi:Uncharacterised protein r2_g3167 [Pycnogonum litorale]
MEEANPEIKSEKPSELSPQSSVTSTVIENVQKEVEQLKINVPVKTEKKRDSSKSKTSASPRCITRKSMLRAISTPNTQSSSINDITFANNVSAIDLPTPAVNRNRVKLPVRKRRSSRIKKKP